MHKKIQSPPDQKMCTQNQAGFAHLFLLVALVAVAAGSSLVGYKFVKERSTTQVEGVSTAQGNVRYLNLEGRFFEMDGETPLKAVNANGGLIRPEVVVTFDTGDTQTFKGAVTGLFSTRGLIIPAGATSFTLKSKVAATIVGTTGDMAGCDLESVNYEYFNCEVARYASPNRKSTHVGMNFRSSINYHSPTAKLSRVNGNGQLSPGDTFQVRVESTPQAGVRLASVKLKMRYSYDSGMHTCTETLLPVIDGPVVPTENRGVDRTVTVTVPEFPSGIARPTYLAIYPEVSTKPLAYRGARHCSGSPLNAGIPCNTCGDGDVTNCERKIELWSGCGTTYPEGQGIYEGNGGSSVAGAYHYVPIAAGTTPPNPDLGKFELEVQRIGGGEVPKVRVTAKGQTVAWDVPIPSSSDRTGVLGSVPNNTRIDDIKVFFVNADENYEINQRGLRVYKIKLHGVDYSTEDPKVYSEGADPVLCGYGFQQGNALYCKNSFFQFSSNLPRHVELQMMGTPAAGGYPMVTIEAGNKRWALFHTNGVMRKYSTSVPNWFTVGEILVKYDNDARTATEDRNLRVDYMKVNNETFQTESAGVYSVGSWDSTTYCAGGYKSSEWLHCNGYFRYQN